MTYRHHFSVALITALALTLAPAALSADDERQMRITGTLNDHVWVDIGAGAGPWQVSGTWNARVRGNGKGEFIAAILGVRSDLWVLQTGADPQTNQRSAHTHHVALLDATVSDIPGGIRMTGKAIMTSNGSAAPFSGSSIVVDLTGGDTVRFSNMKLTFLDASNEHFGSHPYDGVVTITR